MRTHIRKMGEIAQRVPPQGAKTCFVFVCYQCNVTFRPIRPPILRRFRPFLKQQTNRFPHVYTADKFSNFSTGGVHVPKTAHNTVL